MRLGQTIKATEKTSGDHEQRTQALELITSINSHLSLPTRPYARSRIRLKARWLPLFAAWTSCMV